MITNNKNNKAFTFVELIVSVVIITILSTIWFSSYVWYISDSRDSQRKSDLSQLSSSLKVYKQKRWYYWNPWDAFKIVYSWSTNIVALQWKMNKNVHIDSLEKLPLDPSNWQSYSYSITKNKQEFEIVSTLENWDFPKALLTWNYKSVSKHILPTIVLATGATSWSELEIKSGSTQWDYNRTLFVYDNNMHNLVYTFEDWFPSYSDWELTFDFLLSEAYTNNNFWQNSDYRNCVEINEAWKMLIEPTSSPFEYQIIDDDWGLTNTWCTTYNSN